MSKTTAKTPAKKRRSDAAAKVKKRPLDLRYVQARTLTPNPANWRTHPEKQLGALKELIHDDEVGWAGALLFNERTGRLVDGHGRLKVVDPNAYVPVLVGSWSEAAEKKILLTLDPIAAMAAASAEQLRALGEEVNLDPDIFAGLQEELDELLAEADKRSASDSSAGGASEQPTGGSGSITDQYKIVITCRDESHQTEILDALDNSPQLLPDLLKGVESKALVG